MATLDNPSTTIISPVEQTDGPARIVSDYRGSQVTYSPEPAVNSTSPVMSVKGLVVGERDALKGSCSVREFNFSRTNPTDKFSTSSTNLPSYGSVNDTCLNVKVSPIDPTTGKPVVVAYEHIPNGGEGVQRVIRFFDPSKPGTSSMALTEKPGQDLDQQETVAKISRDGSMAVQTVERKFGANNFESVRAYVWDKESPVAQKLPMPTDQATGLEFQFSSVVDMDSAGTTRVALGSVANSSSGYGAEPIAWVQRNGGSYVPTPVPVDKEKYLDVQAFGVRVNEAGKMVIAGQAFGFVDGKYQNVPLLWVENSSGSFDTHELQRAGANSKGEKFNVEAIDQVQTGSYVERTRDGKKIRHDVTFVTGWGSDVKTRRTIDVLYQIGGGKDVAVDVADLVSAQKELPSDRAYTMRNFTVDSSVGGEARALVYGRSLPRAGGNSSSVYSDYSLENATNLYNELASASSNASRQTTEQILASARGNLRQSQSRPADAPPQTAPRYWPKVSTEEKQ